MDGQCPAAGMVGCRHHRMGHHRRHAGQLLSDALNSSVPQIFDTGPRRRDRASGAEHGGDGGCQGKARQDQDRLPVLDLVRSGSHRSAGRVYNDTSTTSRRDPSTAIISSFPAPQAPFLCMGIRNAASGGSSPAGATYLAHAVGAGKTLTMAAAIMEQRRLG
jgi:N12 class adenine-specific DNA methylase